MHVLFVIFVLSVGALLWAAFAVARHIQRHEKLATAPEPEAAELDSVDHDPLIFPSSRQSGH